MSHVAGIRPCLAEYRLFYGALLQKRPMILRSLRIVATLWVSIAEHRLFCGAFLQKRPMILRSLRPCPVYVTCVSQYPQDLCHMYDDILQ